MIPIDFLNCPHGDSQDDPDKVGMIAQITMKKAERDFFLCQQRAAKQNALYNGVLAGNEGQINGRCRNYSAKKTRPQRNHSLGLSQQWNLGEILGLHRPSK